MSIGTKTQICCFADTYKSYSQLPTLKKSTYIGRYLLQSINLLCKENSSYKYNIQTKAHWSPVSFFVASRLEGYEPANARKA